jgi:methionyl-tRNA formyltransferase
MISVVFLGTPAFSLPTLQALADHADISILAVVSQPDRPAGRGQKLTPPPVRVLAEQLGLPLFQTQSIKKDEALQAHLKQLAPDFFVTVAFGQILTQAVLDIPKLGTVNVHASLLPEFRGANPIQQAILQGKTETGLTTMLTELGVDTGPILLKKAIPIRPEDTLGELSEYLSDLGGPLLVDTLIGLKTGTVKPQPQDHDKATHAPKCLKEEAILDWQTPAKDLQRKIHAFNPAPGATTFLNGERFKILKARIFDKHAATQEHSGNKSDQFSSLSKNSKPGEIVSIGDTTAILVQTGSGLLEVQRLQPAGKRDMSARDWALGQLKGDSHRVFS